MTDKEFKELSLKERYEVLAVLPTFTTYQASCYLHTTKQVINKAVKAGKLKSMRPAGCKCLFKKEDILKI